MKTITRSQAIALMRQKCLALVDDEHSLCDVAARLKIMCGGFSQWKFHELKERYDWIVKTRPHVTRKELEDLANRWQLARQQVMDTSLSCDTQQKETLHPVCRGWDTHTNEELARFYHDLTDEEVEVVADPVPSA
jgi:hypothetical protein